MPSCRVPGGKRAARNVAAAAVRVAADVAFHRFDLEPGQTLRRNQRGASDEENYTHACCQFNLLSDRELDVVIALPARATITRSTYFAERYAIDSVTPTKSSTALVIALAFAAGAAVHATGFALMWVGVDLYGPDYPAWRHAVMALVDASIAWVARRHQGWLFVVLPAWATEQALVNGFGIFSIIALAATAGLLWERWCRRRTVAPV